MIAAEKQGNAVPLRYCLCFSGGVRIFAYKTIVLITTRFWLKKPPTCTETRTDVLTTTFFHKLLSATNQYFTQFVSSVGSKRQMAYVVYLLRTVINLRQSTTGRRQPETRFSCHLFKGLPSVWTCLSHNLPCY